VLLQVPNETNKNKCGNFNDTFGFQKADDLINAYYGKQFQLIIFDLNHDLQNPYKILSLVHLTRPLQRLIM
jgi:hypothetical protein